MAAQSEIKKFYNGCDVFITGGTGFLGKILIEKLLRSTDVSTIYLLIRNKKGKNVHTRLDEMFDDIIFHQLKLESPKFKHRVVGIAGDCSITGLGLTITDRQKLIDNVNVVFHVAATVRFNENIKLAYEINVNSTKDILGLCRHMRKLKSMVYVSTAYSNCHLNEIDERFYDYSVNYESVGTLMEKTTKEEADQLTSRIIGQWPNTYTFSKAMAEALIRDTANGLPLGIFRPSIVISTYKEPIEGWIDNLYGPTGVVAGAATGILRLLHSKDEAIADIVPVDTCVAGLIATAWDVASKEGKRTSSNIPIYNFVSSVENAITWSEWMVLNKLQGKYYPLKKAIWSVKFKIVANPNIYLFYRFLYHILPAFVIDFATLATGNKPKLLTMYKKIHKFSNVISFFAIRSWKFSNKNTVNLWNKMNSADKELFPMSITTVPWLTFFRGYVKGMRKYLMHEQDSSLEEARRRLKRFDLMHDIMKVAISFLIGMVIWMIISRIGLMFFGSTAGTTHFMANRTNCDFC